MSNNHRGGGVYDPMDEPASTTELSLMRRVKSAMDHPNAPEWIDSVTDLERSQLAKFVAVRLTRFGK